MIEGLLNLPWFIWAVLAFLVAVINTFVWPQKAVTDTQGFRFFIIRWGRALAWLLLTINFILRGISPSLNGAVNFLALAGGILYRLFIMTTFVIK